MFRGSDKEKALGIALAIFCVLFVLSMVFVVLYFTLPKFREFLNKLFRLERQTSPETLAKKAKKKEERKANREAKKEENQKQKAESKGNSNTAVKNISQKILEKEKTAEELNAAIKADLIAYAGVYRKASVTQYFNCSDTWYSGCGIADATTYNAMYNKMINSVYNNGGFWVQRREDGQYSITCGNAQKKASGFAPDNTKTSSLLFGIQWDLVCKYLEVSYAWTTPPSGKTVQYYINEDSSSWGRYLNSGSPAPGLERNNRMNIYDFAGNY